MRVLHLIDATSPWGGPCTLRLIADVIARLPRGASCAWPTHDVLLIGRSAEARIAHVCGLQALGTICPMRGRPLSARSGLTSWLRAASETGTGPGIIHAWTSSAGALAAIAAPHIPRVVTTHPIAVDLNSPHLLSREVVRERWRREHDIASDEFVLGLLGEPPERFDARQAIHVGARTGLSSRRVRMLMNGASHDRAVSQRSLELLALDHMVIQDEAMARPWEVLRGLDASLIIAPMSVSTSTAASVSVSALPALWAQSAGVPIIAEASAPLHGLVEHDRTGLLFPTGDMNTACERLARLHDEPDLVNRLTSAAREGAARNHSLDVLCSRIADGYRKAIDGRRAEYVTAIGQR